jgi:hypothetical protein
MSPDRIILFLHIPKTGGTTLRKTCIYEIFHTEDRYSAESYLGKARLHSGIYYYPVGFYNKDWALSMPEPVIRALSRKDIRAVTGHFCFGIHQYLSKPSTYITLLRNPVDRIVSLYYHIRRWEHPDPELHTEIISKNLDLEAFVTRYSLRELNNDQTRRISGIEPESHRYSKVALIKAKENLLQHFLVVGVTERFDETLMLLKRIFGWRGELFYYPKHISRSRPSLRELPQSSVDAIKDRNELDIELYRFAKALLEETISSQDAGFYDEVERFKSLNAEYIAALRSNKSS